MNKKNLSNLLFSFGGVIAMLALLVAVNMIAKGLPARADLTENQQFTLTRGTKEILGKIDGQVEIRFYYSRSLKEMPLPLKTYAQRVDDLLSEYQQVAGGKLAIKRLDPKPDSEAEDSANLDGVEGQMLPSGDRVFFGLAIEFVGQKEVIPFLTPQREQQLEYDLSRKISGVLTEEKPVVGIMTALPVFGTPFNPMMAQMGQRQQEPWVFISELKQDFTVEQVDSSVDRIDEKYKVLIVLHPKNVSDKTQYAIDQYLLRGGKLIVMADTTAVMDSQNSGNPMMGAMPTSSSLDKLFGAWGVTLEPGKVVADMDHPTLLSGRNGQPQSNPSVLSLSEEVLNKDDVLTGSIDNLLIPFTGTFSGTPTAGLQQTVLVKSSSNAQLVEGFVAQMSGESILKDFKSGGKELPIAIRLSGKFKTAFPEGRPKDAAPAEQNPEGEKKAEPKTEDSLKESKTDNAVLLVADVDWLYDVFCVEVQNFFGQRIMTPRSGNLSLFQAMVEQFAGDSSLIHVRSRASLNRPFTVMTKMEAEANERYQSKIKEIEQSLGDLQRKLSELQQQKEKGQQRLILSPEQQKEIQEYRKKEVEVNKQLKEERKKLRRDIEALEFKLKLGNIAGMPALVALFGIGLFLIKRKRTAAR